MDVSFAGMSRNFENHHVSNVVFGLPRENTRCLAGIFCLELLLAHVIVAMVVPHARVVFAGLGNMGYPMAACLARAVPAATRRPIGKISAKCCSFSAVSAPIFARKYAFCSIFQNLPDYLAAIFKIWRNFVNFANFAILQKFQLDNLVDFEKC